MNWGIEIITKVENGNLNRNRNLIKKAIESFEGKEIVLKIERVKKQRTEDQNSFYWGVIVQLTKQAILEYWGEVWSKEQIHTYYLINLPTYREVVNKKTGEVKEVLKSSSQMTTIEMSNWWERIGKYMAENFDTVLPEPNKDLKFKL
jgi:hypothetical protein